MCVQCHDAFKINLHSGMHVTQLSLRLNTVTCAMVVKLLILNPLESKRVQELDRLEIEEFYSF